ncbi:hypothetical protein JKP88DRAFT_268001 [Tribonema minus]|uniref:Uncharacterized protein n=1 Tax=Tribonema minus TaxID=303371 RepID=A0A836CKR1_9STRA|nr:hypothetical protein JKP88DRAFT_268001 [Tribonema minus]
MPVEHAWNLHRCAALQLQADLHAGTSNERRCHCLRSDTTFTFGVLSRTVTLKLQLHRQITPRAAAHWQASAGRNGALPTGVQLWDVRCARWAMEPRRVQARRKRLRFRGEATDRSGRRSVLGTPWPNYGCIRLAAYCRPPTCIHRIGLTSWPRRIRPRFKQEALRATRAQCRHCHCPGLVDAPLDENEGALFIITAAAAAWPVQHQCIADDSSSGSSACSVGAAATMHSTRIGSCTGMDTECSSFGT